MTDLQIITSFKGECINIQDALNILTEWYKCNIDKDEAEMLIFSHLAIDTSTEDLRVLIEWISNNLTEDDNGFADMSIISAESEKPFLTDLISMKHKMKKISLLSPELSNQIHNIYETIVLSNYDKVYNDLILG